MADGIYQSLICYLHGVFGIRACHIRNRRMAVESTDTSRMGVYVACATIVVVNTYVLA